MRPGYWFTLGTGVGKVPSRPRTEEEKARHREEQKRRYWSDPERFRAYPEVEAGLLRHSWDGAA
jgi:hypothetical protein